MRKLLAVLLSFVTLPACEADSAMQLSALEAVDQGAVLIDVRSDAEFASGHLEGALQIVHTDIVDGVARLDLAKDTPIVLYCRSGNRSGIATRALEAEGYTRVTNAGAYTDLAALRARQDPG